MKNSTKNETKPNNSKLSFDRSILENARQNGGSVTYYTQEERYNVRTDKTYTKRTPVLIAPLGQQLLFTENGKKTPFTTVVHVLVSTCESLGADYFVVQ